jgi:hypothetical protein
MRGELSRLDTHLDEDMGTALRSMRKENGVQLRARELLRCLTCQEQQKVMSLHEMSFMHQVSEEEYRRTLSAIYGFSLVLESLMSELSHAR